MLFRDNVNDVWKVTSLINKISRSERFHIGDSLNIMQNEIESTLDQIEVNTGKLRKYGTFCDNLWSVNMLSAILDANCNKNNHPW